MTDKREAKIVLIIEDDSDIQRFISRVLELEGYQVLKASGCDRGMEIIREGTVDLVLLDLLLPGRDGWSVLREIKSAHELSAIPVVVLSAVAELPQRERTLRMGATDYLVKPMSARALKETVGSVLRQSRNHSTLPKSTDKEIF
jgi:DNA-binding response OmpR family regulator